VNVLHRSHELPSAWGHESSPRALSAGAVCRHYWSGVHTWDRGITLSGRTVFACSSGGDPAVWPADRSEPPHNLSLTVLSESPSTRQRLRNYGSRLIRIHAFHVARVNRRDHVVVGCSARDSGIRVVHHRDERGVQPRRVWPVRSGATIYVVAAHRGRACRPRQCHRVRTGRHACARKRNCGW